MSLNADLTPMAWDDAAEQLALSLGEYLTDAKEQVSLGNEFIFGCHGAVMLLRPEGHELVVVGFTGRHCLEKACPVIHATAKRIGAKTIRLHTNRRGEMRFLNLLGWPFRLVETRPDYEYVLRMKV